MRSAPVVVAFALGLPLLTSCAVTPPALEMRDVCVSWIDFDAAQDVYDNADAVIIATAMPSGARRPLFGVEVAVYEVTPVSVVKGDLAGQESIEVLSTPLTCDRDGRRYPEDVDPLAREGELLVYLSAGSDGSWRTFSPYDAAELLPEDGSLPFLPGG